MMNKKEIEILRKFLEELKREEQFLQKNFGNEIVKNSIRHRRIVRIEVMEKLIKYLDSKDK